MRIGRFGWSVEEPIEHVGEALGPADVALRSRRPVHGPRPQRAVAAHPDRRVVREAEVVIVVELLVVRPRVPPDTTSSWGGGCVARGVLLGDEDREERTRRWPSVCSVSGGAGRRRHQPGAWCRARGRPRCDRGDLVGWRRGDGRRSHRRWGSLIGFHLATRSPKVSPTQSTWRLHSKTARPVVAEAVEVVGEPPGSVKWWRHTQIDRPASWAGLEDRSVALDLRLRDGDPASVRAGSSRETTGGG